MANKKKSGEICRNCEKEMPLVAVKYIYQCSDCGVVREKTDRYQGKPPKE
ncbi:MAG: hypothetical protein ACOC44_18415 [Promethearchaeia archaeon]